MVKKENKNTMHSHLLGIVSQLNEFHTIPPQIFTTYDSQEYFWEFTSHLPKELITTQYSYSKSVTHLAGADFPGQP